MSMHMPNVPAYYLYGEDWQAESFGFFHIEPFAVRNAQNDWRIGQHLHPDFHQISMLFEGACIFEHDGQTKTAHGPNCVFTPAKVVHRFVYERDSVGYVISFSPDIITSLVLDDRLMMSSVARLGMMRLVELQNDVVTLQLRKLVSLIAELNASNQKYCRDLTRYLFAGCILMLGTVLPDAHANDEQSVKSTGGAIDLYHRLREHLEMQMDFAVRGSKAFDTPLTVEFLASRLSATPHALNAACRRASGRPARDIIQAAILGQATRLLLYTTSSVKEIAYGLGYSHPSHFIRFFKQRRGMTPEFFRQQFKAQAELE
jgi:AraC family transcriptional activator of pobA